MLRFQGKLDQLDDLLLAENDGKFFLCLGELHFGNWIVSIPFPTVEIFVEAAKRGEMEPDRGSCPLVLHALIQVIAEIFGIEGGPSGKGRYGFPKFRDRLMIICQGSMRTVFLD